ncbi:hypothetical protein B0H13DRAFT_1896258 [Mycena leptocephala]|nr:hypothetical protein B0H13DRAFT_1896258 [Mycena leptocephala]
MPTSPKKPIQPRDVNAHPAAPPRFIFSRPTLNQIESSLNQLKSHRAFSIKILENLSPSYHSSIFVGIFPSVIRAAHHPVHGDGHTFSVARRLRAVAIGHLLEYFNLRRYRMAGKMAMHHSKTGLRQILQTMPTNKSVGRSKIANYQGCSSRNSSLADSETHWAEAGFKLWSSLSILMGCKATVVRFKFGDSRYHGNLRDAKLSVQSRSNAIFIFPLFVSMRTQRRGNCKLRNSKLDTLTAEAYSDSAQRPNQTSLLLFNGTGRTIEV